MKERRKLPALDNAKQLNTPDLNEVANKNYTDTILRYGNLATHFPQLETNAKTIVAAINELYRTKSTVIPNPPGEEPTDTLNTVKIDGTVFNIEGGGGGGGISGYETQHYIGTNASNVSQVWDDEAVNTVIQYDFFRYQAIEFPVSTTEEFTFNNDSDIILDADLNFDVSIDDEVYPAPGSGSYGLNKDTIFGYEVRFYLIDTTTNTETFISEYTPQEIIYDMDELPTSSYNLYYNRVEGSGSDIDAWLSYHDSYKLTAETEWGEYHFDGQGDGSSIRYDQFTEEDHQGRYDPHWDSGGGCLTTKAVIAEIPKFYYAGNDCLGLTFSASLGLCWGLVDPMYEDPNNQGAVCRCQFTIEYCEVGTDDWQEWYFSQSYNNLLYTWDMKGTPGCKCPEITDNKSFNFTVESQHNIPLDTGKEYSLRLCLYFGSYAKDPDYSGSPYELYLYIADAVNSNSAFTLEYAVAPTVGGSVSGGGDSPDDGDSPNSDSGSGEPIGPHRNFYCNLKSVISRDFTKLLTGYIVANKKYRIKTTFSFFANGGGLLSAGVKFNSNKAITRIEGYDEIHNGGGGSYVLPIASAETLGGIKVGSGLSINSETGVLSTTGGGGGEYHPGRGIFFSSNITENYATTAPLAEYPHMSYTYCPLTYSVKQIISVECNPSVGEFLWYEHDLETNTIKVTCRDNVPEGTPIKITYVTEETGDIVNADVGVTDTEGRHQLDFVPQTTNEWKYYGTVTDEQGTHTVYVSDVNTYGEAVGNSVCNFYIYGAKKISVYVKQDYEGLDTNYAFVIIGKMDSDIFDIDGRYSSDRDFKGETTPDYVGFTYSTDYTGGEHRIQVAYHKAENPHAEQETAQKNAKAYVYVVVTEYVSGNGEIFNKYSGYGKTIASGDWSHAEGFGTWASANYAHAEGFESKALGDYSYASGYHGYSLAHYAHTEGYQNTVKTISSHAEGHDNLIDRHLATSLQNSAALDGNNSHVEGRENKVYGRRAHAEGYLNICLAEDSHVEGWGNQVLNSCDHAEGHNTIASGGESHTEGYNTRTFGNSSHAENYETIARGPYSHAEGYKSEASGETSHAEGGNTTASGKYSHAEGVTTTASGQQSHAEGNNTVASSYGAHAEGQSSIASGSYSHAEGNNTEATYDYAHAEGQYTDAFASCSHAEGGYSKTQGQYAHAEGEWTVASGWASHSEGQNTTASADEAHAEGSHTTASAQHSHAEGYYNTTAGSHSHVEGTQNTITSSGYAAHVEGEYNEADQESVHVEGEHNSAKGRASHVFGKYNIIDDNPYTGAGYRKYVEIVGNGTDNNARSNARTLDWDGNEYVAGRITVGLPPLSGMDVATKKYVDDHGGGGGGGLPSIKAGTGIASELFNQMDEYNESTASGDYSHAEGMSTTASADGAHAEGIYSSATGQGAHAEGMYSVASGDFSHAEGQGVNNNLNLASGRASHVEGFQSQASGSASHAEGGGTRAIGQESHAEGGGTYAYGNWSHAEGAGNAVYSANGHVEGGGNRLVANNGHVGGGGNIALGNQSYVDGGGNQNTSLSQNSYTSGGGNKNFGSQTHAEGGGNTVSGSESHVEGGGNFVHGYKVHGEGGGNIAYAFGSHIEGKHNIAVGYGLHVEGIENYVGMSSYPNVSTWGHTTDVEFKYGNTYAVGDRVYANSAYYTADEEDTALYFECITAPGQIQDGGDVTIYTPAEWDASTTYASGSVVKVTGDRGFITYYYCVSESVGENPLQTGWNRITDVLSPLIDTLNRSSSYSYYLLDANGEYSSCNVAKVAGRATVTAMWKKVDTPIGIHVEGRGNIATGDYQHVAGKYSSSDANKALIIGNGENNNGVITRSNALTLDWLGNLVIAGDLTTGTTLSTSSQNIAAAINELYSELGSEVSVSQIQHSGTKIAEITIDGTTTDIYSPNGGGGGSTVVVEPVIQSGVNIADITVDGTLTHLYTPDAIGSVTVDDTLSTGTKVATITVDGVDTDILVPSAGSSVQVTQIQESGTHIADIEVDGVTTELYAPNAGGAIIDDTDIALDKTWSSYKINEMFFELAQRVAAIERYLWGQPVLTEDGDNRVTEDGIQRILEENEE